MKTLSQKKPITKKDCGVAQGIRLEFKSQQKKNVVCGNKFLIFNVEFSLVLHESPEYLLGFSDTETRLWEPCEKQDLAKLIELHIEAFPKDFSYAKS
jgi:hypothetical protein